MAELQLSLLDYVPPIPAIHFKGSTIRIPFDVARLNKQLRRVYRCMCDGQWRTLRQISDATGDPEASISARLRDFRNHQYLQQYFVMDSERVPGNERRGIWRYRVRARGP